MREPNQISPLVLRAHVQFHTEIEDGQPVVHVYAHAVDDIVTNQAGLDLTNPAVLPRLRTRWPPGSRTGSKACCTSPGSWVRTCLASVP